MEEKRIFIGSFVNQPALIENFESLKEELKYKAIIKWTRSPQNFHITYCFLGNTPIDQIHKIQNFIQKEFEKNIPVDIDIKGIKLFHRKGKPAIIYAAIDDEKSSVLNGIYKKLEDFLYKERIIEKKSNHFKPHITLGRIKKTYNGFDKIIERYKDRSSGKIKSIKVDVIESQLSPKGALYKKLK